MTPQLIHAVHATRYPLDAFVFVQRGLDFTVRQVHGEPDPDADPSTRHIDGEVLCRGLRDYALEQYGLLARVVLSRWGIHGCEDFGHIVFAMVDAGLMQKTQGDSIRDFQDVFDFHHAFGQVLSLDGTKA